MNMLTAIVLGSLLQKPMQTILDLITKFHPTSKDDQRETVIATAMQLLEDSGHYHNDDINAAANILINLTVKRERGGKAEPETKAEYPVCKDCGERHITADDFMKLIFGDTHPTNKKVH